MDTLGQDVPNDDDMRELAGLLAGLTMGLTPGAAMGDALAVGILAGREIERVRALADYASALCADPYD
jgi:hypothetical protein